MKNFKIFAENLEVSQSQLPQCIPKIKERYDGVSITIPVGGTLSRAPRSKIGWCYLKFRNKVNWNFKIERIFLPHFVILIKTIKIIGFNHLSKYLRDKNFMN